VAREERAPREAREERAPREAREPRETRDESVQRLPRRERERDRRDDRDLGPPVRGFGDSVPAFMLIPIPRPRREAGPSGEPEGGAEAEAA
jgi:hypothetical protein